MIPKPIDDAQKRAEFERRQDDQIRLIAGFLDFVRQQHGAQLVDNETGNRVSDAALIVQYIKGSQG